MDVDETSTPTQASNAREKTTPFLIRAFVKIGSFHRLTLFEDSTLPTTDEQQLYAWKDSTLRELLTILRNTAPSIPEYRHPLARVSFRTVYADSGNRGRFSQKDLGIIYSRDILGEPGNASGPSQRLLEDDDVPRSEREKEERSLEELRFMPGDFLLVAVFLPKSVTTPTELSIKGRKGDNGWSGTVVPSGPPSGRGSGGHWRGESNGPVGRGRGRGRDRDKDFDRNVPPPRSAGWDRGGRRSRSPRGRR